MTVKGSLQVLACLGIFLIIISLIKQPTFIPNRDVFGMGFGLLIVSLAELGQYKEVRGGTYNVKIVRGRVSSKLGSITDGLGILIVILAVSDCLLWAIENG